MTTHPVRYAEDYKVGDVFELGERTISKEEIIVFSRQWDPHPFHVDEEAAKATIFKGLIASGWHVGLIMMRMLHEGGFLSAETSAGSPGHDELRWIKPVRPGDRLIGRVEVLGARMSKSRPDLGLISNHATLRGPDGDVFYSLKSVAMIKARGAAKPG